jgi:hypothetical protein
MPQPAPRFVDRFGNTAAQLRGQSGNQHRVLLIGLVDGQVLTGAARARSASAAHTRTASPGPRRAGRGPASGDRSAHTPPSPRPSPFAAARSAAHSQRRPEIPSPATECLTGQLLRVVIGHTDHPLRIGQIDPHDRVAHRHQRPQPSKPGVAVAITPGTRRHRCPRTSSSCDGTPSPTSASGGRSHVLRSTRRASFCALIACGRGASARPPGAGLVRSASNAIRAPSHGAGRGGQL